MFTRYALGEQAKGTEELARFLLVWVALLGAAVALGTRAHLGVGFFVNQLQPDARKQIAVAGHLVVLFSAGAVFLGGGMRVVSGAAVENLIRAVTNPAADSDPDPTPDGPS